MQSRKLDGYSRAVGQGTIARARADPFDGFRVGIEIARGIVRRTGALAQHVERKAKPRIGIRCARKRLIDRLAEHEMIAKHAHCLARGEPDGGRADAFRHLRKHTFKPFLGVNHPRGNAERPGRCVDGKCVGLRLMAGEIAVRQLVFDQPVGGRGVRNAQQRFRENHQREALLGGERIFAQQFLDAAEAAATLAHGADEIGGAFEDAPLGSGVKSCGIPDAAGDERIVFRIGSAERKAIR
jgi:hypothetical protein